MLVVHSGGWALAGVGGVQRVRPDADRWRARGWQTVSFANRMCGRSIGDVLWFYDRARKWFGAHTKICALGTSAGGNLALLIGAHRPNLYCAVPTIRYQQAGDLADAMRAANPSAYVDSYQLATGTIAFAHGHVTQAALDDFYAREERLVAPIEQPTVALSKR